MRALTHYHPITIGVYLLLCASVAMLCRHPLLLLLALAGAVSFYLVRNGRCGGRSHLWFLLLFAVTALWNPILSHDGETVLFFSGNTPITWEAICYGLLTATALLAVAYWFRSFSQIMTSDKLLCLFGAFSPKLALLCAMGLRYLPLLARQAKKVQQTQTVMGLYREENIVSRIRGGMRVLSILLTWALEKGVVTADSMTARGYGIGRRTHFSRQRFQKRDALLLTPAAVLFSILLFGIGRGAFDFSCYPRLTVAPLRTLGCLGSLSYGGLVFLPTILEWKEARAWRYLRSSI